MLAFWPTHSLHEVLEPSRHGVGVFTVLRWRQCQLCAAPGQCAVDHHPLQPCGFFPWRRSVGL